MTLPVLAEKLRIGELALADYLARLEKHLKAREPEVLAFYPNQGVSSG